MQLSAGVASRTRTFIPRNPTGFWRRRPSICQQKLRDGMTHPLPGRGESCHAAQRSVTSQTLPQPCQQSGQSEAELAVTSRRAPSHTSTHLHRTVHISYREHAASST
ncbi:hypothetical protein J6590_038571 [Homalodisca vitripennis]|nr:hypothetical protein J6590_038571 [Homalodisca vitripennis]